MILLILLTFAKLLHLKHTFHDEFILTLLISMALILALPWKIKLGLPAFVEGDQKVCALISVCEWNLVFHHFCLCCYHLLRWSWYLHFLSLLSPLAFSLLRLVCFVSTKSTAIDEIANDMALWKINILLIYSFKFNFYLLISTFIYLIHFYHFFFIFNFSYRYN